MADPTRNAIVVGRSASTRSPLAAGATTTAEAHGLLPSSLAIKTELPNDEWFYSEKCKSIVQELDAQKLRECMLVRSPASLVCPPLAEEAYGRFSACSTSWTHCEHRSSGYGHQTSRGSSSWQVRAIHVAGLRACSAQGWRPGFGADVRKQLVDQTQRADSAEAESAQLRASLRREKFSFELERMNQIQVH